MKFVVVGGQARKVGKTSVIEGLIRGLSTLGWTAVKITPHEAGDEPQQAPEGDEFPGDLDFLLREEGDPGGHGDTCRYLAAGARRSLWLRVRGDGLGRAVSALLKALEGDEHVIVESNRLLRFLDPSVFVMVTDESSQAMKASAREFLGRVDAFVTVEREPGQGERAATSWQGLEGRPVFPVPEGTWSNPALCRFVAARLRTGVDMPALNKEEIGKALKSMPEWSYADNAIHRTFTFKSFMPAIAFVNKIAEAAERANHHPDITINYNRVGISLSTHSESGVTQKDFQLAGTIDKIFESGN